MKHTKKILSVILSILMIMSAMTVGLTALAADKTDAVAAFEEKADAFDVSIINKAEPSEAEIAAYNEFVAAYTALSAAERETLDVFVFDKAYGAVFNREYQLGRAAGKKLADAYKDAAAKMSADLAKSLTEEKFAGAVEVLNAADASLGQDAWKTVEFKNGDMGFKDGDREGFLDACAAIFRPFSLITLALTLENSINTSSGTYTYNGYEKLVTVFEALDLRGVVSSHEYTLAVNAVITLATSNTPGMAITTVTNVLPFVRLFTQVVTFIKMIFEKIKEFFSIFTK